MPPFNLWKKRPSEVPSSGLASSHVTQQLQLPTSTNSQSHVQLPQKKQQSQPVGPWSAHIPPSGQWPSPFPRYRHAISTTATAAGELFLFGGMSNGLSRGDLYVISTRDFSTTLVQTSGDVPSPRYAHCAIFTSTILLIWGGVSYQNVQYSDDSLYLLNLVSREWTRIAVNGPGPCGRFCHTMSLVSSKLFLFGGQTSERLFNDIWASDLNCLNWESYEPAPGDKKPLPRSAHVSVITGDRITIFGGGDDSHVFNDTWSYNISTRKWTELQCTGSIPPPRAGHAAVLIDDVMYVYGGGNYDGTFICDLTALNLTTQRWIAFQGIGPSPSGRFGHAMACDGTRVFVLGGFLSPGIQADRTKLIHVLDTKQLVYLEADSDAVNRSEKATQLAGKSSASLPTRGQPHQPSSSSSEVLAALEYGRLIELERQRSETVVPKTERDRHIGQPIDELTLKNALLAQAAEKKERAGLELRNLQAKLDESLLSRDQAKANAAEETKRAGLEQRELRAKLDELTRSRDQAKANAAEGMERAGLEQRELQAKLDELTLSRDELLRTLEQARGALQKATSRSADANERSQPVRALETELAEVRAELEGKQSELAAVRLRLTDAEDGLAKSKAEADTLRAQTADLDRLVHRLMERMRAMENEMSSLRGNEKSMEDMECRNEG